MLIETIWHLKLTQRATFLTNKSLMDTLKNPLWTCKYVCGNAVILFIILQEK